MTSTNSWTVSNEPFVIWRIKNPHVEYTDQLEISKIQNGITETSLYTWNSANDAWTLTTGDGARTEIKTKVIDPLTGDRTDTFTVANSLGETVSKTARTYHQFPWNEELIKEVVDPEGAALTTVYSYYENVNEVGRYRRLKSITNADGSWERYDYDSVGNQVLVLRPWKDQALASASEATSYSIRTTYSNYDGFIVSLHARLVSSVVERIAGVIIRKTTYSRVGTTLNGEPAVIETQTAYASATVTQVTLTTKYHYTASDFLLNRVASIQYPDGRKDTYTYEKGDYTINADPSLNQFTPNPAATAQRQTIIHGTSANPDGIAFKSTKEISVRNQFGHAALQEVYVYTGSAYARVSWSVLDYDDRGHSTQTRHNNGTLLSSIWNGDHKTSDIDENGIEIDYTYDSLNRIATRTKKGAPAVDGFPAQTDIVTSYGYDAAGRVKTETTASGGLSLVKSTSYDVAGRTKTETDPAGLITKYAYTNGGRTETTTFPGGATQIADRYLDGQTKTILGSAVIGLFFDYGVNADGTPFSQEFLGSAGASSPRWTKTNSDWLGRATSVERPSVIAGTNVVQLSIYNALGQLQGESILAGANKLQADKLYEYDSLGNLVRVGMDIDASGSLTLSSTDRIVETDSVFQQTGNDWFRVSTNKTYLTDGNSTSTTKVIQSERLTNFAVNGAEITVADVVVTYVSGNQTRTTTVVDGSARKQTTRTDQPDSTVDALTITYNGLVQSAVPATPTSPATFTYDALARLVSASDPITGTSSKIYNPATGQLSSETRGSQTTSYDYYSPSVANAGRLKSRTNANGKKVYFNYSSRGEMVQTWGDATYPVEYVFDAYGQRTEMHTFRAGSGWQGASWPTATVGTIDVTRWVYQDATGLLAQKQDASLKQILYAYDALGRIASRRWARNDSGGNPVVTTYSYDPNSADMIGISYSDGTPSLAFTYDRGGRRLTVSDGAGTHNLTHNAAGQLETDEITNGLLDGVTVTVGYDSFLRRESFQGSHNALTITNQSYGYDTSSRLQTVTSGSQVATFAYYPTSGLLSTTTFTGGSQIVRSYDALGRLETIATSSPAVGTIASYSYNYNNLSQRTRVTREDNSYWSYNYNDRGELISGKKYWSDNTPVAGQQTEYAFDSIGNRTAAKTGGDAQGLNLRQATFTANSLNQYQQRTVPGALDILGTANALATLTVNDLPAYRRGAYFYKELSVDNSAAPAYPQVKVVGVRTGIGGAGEDAVTQIDGHIYVPKNVEVYAYDADGNLTSDGRWTYSWDAENRLTSMQAVADVPVTAKLRLEFVYDYMGRRIQKKVYGWNVATGSYQLQTTTKFLYDGWNLIAELDGNNANIRNYVWAFEGLLSINEAGNSYFAGSDGNQNVTLLVKASTGATSALYDYDPFGNALQSTGDYASANPFRFSSKYEDKETGLIYYGYRYYQPQIGRWTNVDPSGEQGGPNLNEFLGNDGINGTDYLGLWKKSGSWSGGWHNYTGNVIADEKCNSLRRLAYLITGSESDWTKLRRPEDNVKKGQSVNIGPLLDVLEEKLRPKVVAATSAFKAKGFGPLSVTITGGSPSDDLNQFFGNEGQMDSDCLNAVESVLRKGLLELIGSDLYDKLKQDHPAMFSNRKGAINSMRLGDIGWFPNYADYLRKVQKFKHQAFQAENVIKIAEDQYWGFTGENEIHSQKEWEIELRNAYNAPDGTPAGTQRNNPIPGFLRPIRIDFLNVPRIAGQLFDLRNN